MSLFARVASRLACWGAVLAMAGQSAHAAPETLLRMDVATQTRLGVATATLTPAYHSTTHTGFARALDPVPLAQLQADIAAAAAAAAASKAQAERTKSLNAADQTVATQVVEAAAAQAQADAAKLLLLHRRVGLEWSPALARWSDVRLGRLVSDIAAGRAALVRIDAAGGLADVRGAATLDLGGRPARAEILGVARVGDPRLQSTGVLALVTGPQAERLGAGTVAPATIASGAGASGVILPGAALLRSGGRTWVYIRRSADQFERRDAGSGKVDPDGLFVTSRFKPGEAVVVSGASQLFAAQTGADKSGKAD